MTIYAYICLLFFFLFVCMEQYMWIDILKLASLKIVMLCAGMYFFLVAIS